MHEFLESEPTISGFLVYFENVTPEFSRNQDPKAEATVSLVKEPWWVPGSEPDGDNQGTH